MPSLSFTLLPTAISRLHEALSCLAKFDESVFLEAFPTYLSLSTINTPKTAYACFKFDALSFFDTYNHDAVSDRAGQGPQGCLFLNKAMISVFKKRSADGKTDKQNTVEQCEVQLFSGSEEAECRLLIRMHCRNSVVYTYRLTYEAVEVMHAKYDQNKTENHWAIESKVLREVGEYFGPKTEHLDWSYSNEKVTFTSYTEKVQHGREILKQPMHTSVALEQKDFNDFEVQEELHICIVVKDFRAIVALADAFRTEITARYSQGNRPLQFSFEIEGMTCEFTLMTRGHSTATETASKAGTPARNLSVRPTTKPSQPVRQITGRIQNEISMPPPPSRSTLPRPTLVGRGTLGPSTNESAMRPPPSTNLDPNSLFLPADDDQAWDEPNYGAEEDDVGWDASINPDSFASDPTGRLRDGGFSQAPLSRENSDHPGIAPTQRLSEVQGLFD